MKSESEGYVELRVKSRTLDENEESEALVAIKELFDEAIPKLKKAKEDNITDAEEENSNSQT
jgi:hypothetical protein